MNTRVAVPLTQEAYDAVTFLAKVGSTSRGKVLAEAVEAALPSLIKIADAFRHAETLSGEEKAHLVRRFEASEKILLDALTEVDGCPLIDQRKSDATVPRGVSRASAGVSDPPYTNRGVPVPRDGGSR